MKIALAITGFPRFFNDTYKSVRNFILDRYDGVTFAAIYEPCPEREYERTVWPYSRRSYFRRDFIVEFSECFNPVRSMDCKIFVDELPRLVEESKDIPRSTGRKYAHRGIYSQMETWKKTAELIGPYASEFDLVIKYRTDVLIHEFNADLERIAQTDALYVSNDNAMGWTVGQHGEVHGGICELMWIGRPETHFKAVSVFDNLLQYSKTINSCHAEKLFGHHLNSIGMHVETFPCKLSFEGDRLGEKIFQFRDEM